MDTDICIHILRGNQRVLRRREEFQEDVAVSFMTVAELHYGAEKSVNPVKNRTLVDQFLLTVITIETNAWISRRFAKVKADLEREGVPLQDADIFIAATALETCDLLVSANTKHFERIPELRMEDWTRAS